MATRTLLRGRYCATIAKIFFKTHAKLDSVSKGGIRDSCHLIVKQLFDESAFGNRTPPQKLMIVPGHPPECIRLDPIALHATWRLLFAVWITVRKWVGLYG